MHISRRSVLAAGACVALGAENALAASTPFCPSSPDGACFNWGVPETSARSGAANVYFQLVAPSTWQYVALGTGSMMSGADMFIVYPDGTGNVTLSTRKGTGHSMPMYSQRSDIELLAGSGIVDGKMIANVKCTACSDMTTSGESDWIAAWRTKDAMASTNVEAPIRFHDGFLSFKTDLSKASISADSNPFVAPGNNSADTGSNTGTPSDGGSTGGSSGDSSGGAVTGTTSGDGDKAVASAHGIIMAIVFLIGYPVGGILMPLVGKWFIHAGWQVLALLGMWAGFGTGYIAAKNSSTFFDQTHTRMGVIVCALITVQPVLGYIHHRHYKLYQGRGVFSHVHIWYGRALMLIGIVNGGLGLQLSRASNKLIIAYSVVGAVFSVLYIGASAYGSYKRRQRKQVISPARSYEAEQMEIVNNRQKGGSRV